MDDDEWDIDDSFLAAVDQLVAQHNGKAQQLTQPDSPNARAAAAGAGAPAVATAQPAPPPLQPQRAAPAGTHCSGPPLPNHALGARQQPRPGAADSSHPQHLQQQQQLAPVASLARPEGRLLLGRVSQAAPELGVQPWPFQPAAQGQPGGPPLPADPQQLLAQMQQERDRLQRELGAMEGTNKLLRTNLDQAERERINLRQRLQQMEAKAPAAGSTQSSFTMGEMQKQLDALKQQLMFREQEMEELKRQQSDKLERLREAEAAVQSLQAQVQDAQAAKQQQQQRSVLVERGQRQGVSGSVADPHRSSMQQQTGRGAGQKRRQSEGGEAASVAPVAQQARPAAPLQASPLGAAAVAAALDSGGPSEGLVSRLWAVCGQSLSALLGAGPSGAGHAGGGPMHPLLPPPAAAAGTASAVPALFGAPGGAAATPTVLLLRLQAKASVAAAPDALAASFSQAFGRQLQQVALGHLPAAALVDSIGSLAAAVVVGCHGPGGDGQAGAVPGARAAAVAGSRMAGTGQGAGGISPQQAWLLAEGLHVLQHLLDNDASCRQAAVESSCGAGARATPAHSGTVACSGGPCGLAACSSAAAELERLQLSARVSLRGTSSAQGLPTATPAVSTTGACRTSGGCPGLPQCEAVLRQHAGLFEKKGQGLASILVAVATLAGQPPQQQQQGVLGAALGVLCALAAGMVACGCVEVLSPVLETGAMAQFLRPLQLRARALHLLHLLLCNPSLAQAFEQSLAQAAPGVQGGETPASHKGTGAHCSSDMQSSSKEQPGSKDGSGSAHQGSAPMQVDGSGWAGAPAVLHYVLQSLTLAPTTTPEQHKQQQQQQQSAARRGGKHSRPPGEQQGPAAWEQCWAAASGQAAGGGGAAAAACVVPRQALMLVAMLREQGTHGILLHLLSSDDSSAGHAGGEGLCQRLVQLVDGASMQQGAQGGPSPLLPVQFPSGLPGVPAAEAGDAVGGTELAAAQLEWQQRLRLMQEALTLLRGLLADDSLGGHALDELCASPAASRLCLASLGRVSRLEPPRPRAATASYPPLPLALWAHAIGSSSKAEIIGITGQGALGRGALRVCSVADVVYMARGMRHRVLCRLKAAQP